MPCLWVQEISAIVVQFHSGRTNLFIKINTVQISLFSNDTVEYKSQYRGLNSIFYSRTNNLKQHPANRHFSNHIVVISSIVGILVIVVIPERIPYTEKMWVRKGLKGKTRKRTSLPPAVGTVYRTNPFFFTCLHRPHLLLQVHGHPHSLRLLNPVFLLQM